MTIGIDFWHAVEFSRSGRASFVVLSNPPEATVLLYLSGSSLSTSAFSLSALSERPARRPLLLRLDPARHTTVQTRERRCLFRGGVPRDRPRSVSRSPGPFLPGGRCRTLRRADGVVKSTECDRRHVWCPPRSAHISSVIRACRSVLFPVTGQAIPLRPRRHRVVVATARRPPIPCAAPCTSPGDAGRPTPRRCRASGRSTRRASITRCRSTLPLCDGERSLATAQQRPASVQHLALLQQRLGVGDP